jgi:membrane protease YdiL (CAAX protease family)
VESSETIGPEGQIPETISSAVWTPPSAPLTPPSPAGPPRFIWENPGWSFPVALLVWIGSVLLLFTMSLIFAVPFFIKLFGTGATAPDVTQQLVNNPQFLVWQLVSTLPAHLLTLLLIWGVVTRIGRRPFFRSVQWGWGDRRDLFAIAGGVVGAAALLGLSVVLKSKIGGGETTIDKLIESSAAARYVIAVLAAVTAPLVEELVYRGLLYPAAQRGAARVAGYFLPDERSHDSIQIGSAILAVLFVSALFAGVHVSQYSNNAGVITAIAMLSLVLTASRALTGRVLPGFVIHLTFNGIQALALVFGPNLEKKIAPPPAPTAALIVDLLHYLPFVH